MSDLESLVTSAYKIAVTKLQTEKIGCNILKYNDFICNKFVTSVRYKSISKLQTGGRSYVY
jgi:hypothetical protein